MAISPNDFSLWARLTGNKYPSTPAERAKKGPEVHNFIQNLGKEGMLGGKEAEEPKKERNLGVAFLVLECYIIIICITSLKKA